MHFLQDGAFAFLQYRLHRRLKIQLQVKQVWT